MCSDGDGVAAGLVDEQLAAQAEDIRWWFGVEFTEEQK